MNITQELPAEQIVSKRGRVTIVILSGIERSVAAVMSIKRPNDIGNKSGTAEFTGLSHEAILLRCDSSFFCLLKLVLCCSS